MTIQESRPAVAEAARVPRLRLRGLTGLRYFAALAVVLVHVTSQFTDSDLLTTASSYGYVGVTFFFLLSGFVLTWSYSGQGVARFWWLRFSRIWPLHMTLMVLWFTVVVERAHLPKPFTQAAVLSLAQAWDPHRSVYFAGNFVSWSLSCEMFFYLVFPFAVVLVRRLNPRGIAVAASVTLALQLAAPLMLDGVLSAEHYRWMFYVFPPYRFGEFLLGMLLARAVALGLRVRRPAWGATLSTAGLALLCAGMTGFTVGAGHPVDRPVAAILSIPLLGLLLLSVTSAEMVSGTVWLGCRPLVRLGEWSFALYLLHEAFFQLTQRWEWWDDDPLTGTAGLVGLLSFVLVSTLLAAGLHYLVERPVERFLRRIAPGTRARPAPARRAVAGAGPQ